MINNLVLLVKKIFLPKYQIKRVDHLKYGQLFYNGHMFDVGTSHLYSSMFMFAPASEDDVELSKESSVFYYILIKNY